MPHLKDYAREHRNNPTRTEAMLWKHLKGKFLGTFDFHRQKPIDRYIADFISIPLHLVIEIDGSIHLRPDIVENDFEKEKCFNNLNLNVLRFENEEVENDLAHVLQTIDAYILGFTSNKKERFCGCINSKTGMSPFTAEDFVAD